VAPWIGLWRGLIVGFGSVRVRRYYTYANRHLDATFFVTIPMEEVINFNTG